jgi:nucleotide-binding universal stress UspA family protein
MNPDAVHAIRRILVALDSSRASLAALEAAVDLAGRIDAELLGIFVEDIELLRMADAPYAREILYPSAMEAPLSRGSMERNFKAQSEQARTALERAAQQAHVRWSFRTVRGEVTAELLAAAAETDLLAMGKLGWSIGTQVRIGSSALELAASSIPVLLLPASGVPAKPHWLVYYDDSPAARRALLSAAQLAEADSRSITVLLATADAGEAASMKNEIGRLLSGRGLTIEHRSIDPTEEIALLEALRSARNVMFVVGGSEAFQKLPALEAVLRECQIPVLLLRNRAGFERK